MADITFSEIEAGLVARIDSELPYLAKCASYAGQIDDVNDGLPVEAPGCFVMFDGFTRDGGMSDHRQHVGTADFSVVVVADSFVGGTQSRTGDGGAYELVDAVIAAVDDDDLDITDFSGCTLAGVEMVRVDKIRAVYRVRFSALLAISR